MTILITGANRGVGRGLWELYRERGERAIGTTRGEPGEGYLQLDVADPASHTAMAQHFGDAPLDLLVCNAGILNDRSDTLEEGYPAAKWAETFATNVTGVFLTIQSLLPNLRAAKGKIAIISSQLGSQNQANGGVLIYRASKAAALNIGRNLATELKPDGIAVGIYHPGWVQTDMGGSEAAITVEQSASGLASCFDSLDLSRTGCFETYEGRAHPL